MMNLMELPYLLLWGSLALCLAMTVGGMLIIFRRDRQAPAGFSYLQYFHILCHLYGYYALWSTVLLTHFGDATIAGPVNSMITLLGSPFFLLALIMQILWVNGRRARPLRWPALVLLMAGIAVLSLLLALSGWPGLSLVVVSTAGSGLFTSMLAVALLLSTQRRQLDWQKRTLLSGLLILTALLHGTELLWQRTEMAEAMVSILLFYLLHTAFVVVYAYAETRQQQAAPESGAADSMESMLAPYGISRREADIVRGIYAGQTNQEIADTLFITLQTVKDHCSRIYQKTQVKNRSQLAALIRGSERQ